MSDNVTSTYIHAANGNHTLHLTNESDSTGEDGSTPKVDISGLVAGNGLAATYTAIQRIEFSVWGFNYVTLYWDADTDDEIAVLKGNGVADWSLEGGKVDPRSTGTTGDVKLVTDGGADGSGYDMTIWFKAKN